MLGRARTRWISRGFGLSGLVVLSLVCVLLLPTEASSQEDTSGAFGDSVDVVVVGVEVVVTDRSGRRVTDLERDDFRLLVDGREVPIGYFAEIRDGRAVTVTADPAAAAPEAGEAVPTNHLLFLDEYYTIRTRREHVLGRILAQLDRLPAEDRMAVVAFDGERIEVLSDWSADRQELRQALTRAIDRPSFGLLRSEEWENRTIEREVTGPFAANWSWAGSRPAATVATVDSELGRVTAPVRDTGALIFGDADRLVDPFHDVWQQDWELHRVLNAIGSALRFVPRPEGRNVLHLVAGGWPAGGFATNVLRAHELSSLAALPTGYGRAAPLDDLELIWPVVDTANLLGYTVYPIDADGYRPGPEVEETFRLGTLRALAQRTGGRALLFQDRDDSLEEVVRDTRTYYSLGFTPERKNDDVYHEIRVEVARPGVDVRSRAGYRDFSRETELDLLAESALRFADGTAGVSPAGDGLRVELGAPQRRPRDTMKVPLALEVPWSALTLLPTSEGWRSRLEIRLAARDLDGALSEVATVPLGLAFDAEPGAGGHFRWETDLLLRRQPHDLVVSLYDGASGRVLTRTVSVAP